MKAAKRNVERIRRKVDSGRYSSVDDVLDSALELLVWSASCPRCPKA